MTSVEPLRVLVVGAGMYVCGTGTPGYGTVLPSLLESAKSGAVGAVTLAGTDPSKGEAVMAKVESLRRMMGSSIPVEYFPRHGEVDSSAYLSLARSGQFDCAIVSVPDHLHFKVASDVMSAGLHALVVKPLATRLRDVDELIRIRDANGVHAAVEFHKRFDEANLRIRRLLRGGGLGELLYVLVEFSQRRSIPLVAFRKWAPSSNSFQYLGVHYADLIFFLTGATPQRVTATSQSKLLASEGIDSPDAVQALIEWKSAGGGTFTSTILTSWVDPSSTSAMSDQRIKLIGTGARIESNQKERGLRLIPDQGLPEEINPYFSEFNESDGGGHSFGGYGFRSIEQFLNDAFARKRGIIAPSGRPTLEDARVSTAVVEAVNVSLERDGAWVALDPSSLEIRA